MKEGERVFRRCKKERRAQRRARRRAHLFFFFCYPRELKEAENWLFAAVLYVPSLMGSRGCKTLQGFWAVAEI